MTELEQYFKSYFEVIQPEELNKITNLFQLITLRKGEYFLNPGEICHQFCFISNGMLRVFTHCEGKEITQWIATKGHFGTDLSSFFFQKPSRWSIQALVDTKIFMITKAEYSKIGEIVPNWLELEKNFIIKCLTYMEDRIFSHLSMSAEERYHFFFENNREVFKQVPMQYIASLLGMTPETFSRIRKKNLS